MRSIVIGSFLLLLAGCATTPAPQVIYKTASLPLPPRPVLPHITGQELSCLKDSTYHKMVLRQRARRNYAEQLEAIIKATHNGKK